MVSGGGAPPAPSSPALPSVPQSLIPLLPPPPSPISHLVTVAVSQAGGDDDDDALAAGFPVMTSSTTTGMKALLTPTPNVVLLTGTKGDTDPSTVTETVLVTGPKVPVGVHNYPEYDEIKAKNGGKDLTWSDYRDIMNQLPGDYPDFFALQKAGNTKFQLI